MDALQYQPAFRVTMGMEVKLTMYSQWSNAFQTSFIRSNVTAGSWEYKTMAQQIHSEIAPQIKEECR